jgi:hypothetical protein
MNPAVDNCLLFEQKTQLGPPIGAVHPGEEQ